MLLGFLVAGLIGSLQANQPGQGRGMPVFQAQRGIGRIMALGFAGMVVIVALQFEGAKHARHLDAGPALVVLARLGLVVGVRSVGCLLKQKTHQRVSRLEDQRTHQHFQLLNAYSGWLGGLEARHQLLDFLVLGQEDFRSEVFFFTPAARSARVCSITSWAYWVTKP